MHHTTDTHQAHPAPSQTADLAARFATLAPALEDATVADLPAHLGHTIDGRIVDGAGPRIDGVNPATGATLYTTAYATTAEVDAAFAAARRAQPAWAALDASIRGRILFNVARRLAEQARRFAVVETLDGGKPIRESRDVDVPLAAQHFFHYAGWADKLPYANLGPAPAPVGVAAQVIPWNFPLLMAAWKLAPALACGNTVVLKPAESSPATAWLLARVLEDAGVPAGVVNMLHGDGTVGAAMVAHAGADKVAFTGSTEVGKAIARTLAGTNKRLTLELGGKGANIVYADADLDAAVEGIIQGIFFNQGHVCCAGSRLLVQESVLDEVLERLAARASRIIIGNPLDKNTELGAIHSANQLASITAAVAAARAAGAVDVPVACDLPSTGWFYKPTILRATPNDAISRLEVFGPVCTVLPFRTPAEAVELANNTPYGLACGVFTQHPDKAAWTAARLEAGLVWVNTYNVFDPTIPFGGRKESGFGREGGRAGLEAYCV